MIVEFAFPALDMSRERTAATIAPVHFSVDDMFRRYISNPKAFGTDPHLRINPRSLAVNIIGCNDMHAEIENSNEAIEDAGVEGDMSEDAADYQVRQNPDFYPVKSLVAALPSGVLEPDKKAIGAVAAKYF